MACGAGCHPQGTGTKSNAVYFKTGSYVQKAKDEPANEYALSYLYGSKVTKP